MVEIPSDGSPALEDNGNEADERRDGTSYIENLEACLVFDYEHLLIILGHKIAPALQTAVNL